MTPPVFPHGHLRLYLLSLLAEHPMHGYDLIHALRDRFGGTYVPSAGTIYPRLGKLEEEGLVAKTVDGRKTIYSITDAGRAELEAREAELNGIESGVTDSVRRLADEVRTSVNDAMRTLRADLAAAAREAPGQPDRSASGTGSAEANQTEADASSWSTNSTSGSSASTDRSISRLNAQRAEAVVNEFRTNLRSDLRNQLAHGDVTGDSVALLTAELESVRHKFIGSLERQE
jgi:DNA-binding PadR family transcriptional regulator